MNHRPKHQNPIRCGCGTLTTRLKDGAGCCDECYQREKVNAESYLYDTQRHTRQHRSEYHGIGWTIDKACRDWLNRRGISTTGAFPRMALETSRN